MDTIDLQLLTEQIQDETGLDRRTAEQIALAQLAPPDPASAPTTSAIGRHLGWYKEAVIHTHPHFGKLFPCKCTLAARDQHLKQRSMDILSKLQDDLGSELSMCRFETFDLRRAADEESQASLAFALDAARRFLTDPRQWLYFYGAPGVGKSHLAAAIALAWVDSGLGRVAYASVPKLLRFLRAGYSDGSADDRLTALQLVELLILDDLGTEYHKPGEGSSYGSTDSLLFELIADRYSYGRATIITSNVSIDEIDTRIGSRIKGKARRIFMDNADQRGVA
jgi:DNA replication protein DnaC